MSTVMTRPRPDPRPAGKEKAQRASRPVAPANPRIEGLFYPDKPSARCVLRYSDVPLDEAEFETSIGWVEGDTTAEITTASTQWMKRLEGLGQLPRAITSYPNGEVRFYVAPRKLIALPRGRAASAAKPKAQKPAPKKAAQSKPKLKLVKPAAKGVKRPAPAERTAQLPMKPAPARAVKQATAPKPLPVTVRKRAKPADVKPVQKSVPKAAPMKRKSVAAPAKPTVEGPKASAPLPRARQLMLFAGSHVPSEAKQHKNGKSHSEAEAFEGRVAAPASPFGSRAKTEAPAEPPAFKGSASKHKPK